MEDNKKIVKVYSNNNKKTRLKRNKNKFQRIWDAEKQTYVKVRKAKYPVFKKEKKEEDIKLKMNAIKRRQKNKKKSDSVPARVLPENLNKLPGTRKKKSEVKNVRKEPARINGKVTNAKTLKINGMNLQWDDKVLRYKQVA